MKTGGLGDGRNDIGRGFVSAGLNIVGVNSLRNNQKKGVGGSQIGEPE